MVRLWLILWALAWGVAAGAAEEKPVPRPNFVFFLTDDISPDDIGPYGNRGVRTPQLDRMAERGLVFDQAYLTTSSCSPSRCSIITGRYPHNTGAPELHTELPAAQDTFIRHLRDAGYHTVLSGKNHMAPAGRLGFVENSDSKPAGSENWLRHLRERPRDRPFFAWFASHDAHHPFEPDDRLPAYAPAEIPVPPMLADGPATRAELAEYYREVSRTDRTLGELMAELERQGIAENTYVIYCSDNGRPFPRCKTYLYDSGIRTPLIITGPGVARGRTASLVSAVDFAATFLDLAGVAVPETVQGVSFKPVLADPAAVTRTVAFAERNWHVYQNHARAVRSGDFLYIWNAWPERHDVSAESAQFGFPAARELWRFAEEGRLTPAQALMTRTPKPAEMLFNVRRDPHQFGNLAGDPALAGTLERMRRLLAEWQQETADSVPRNPTPDRQELHSGTAVAGFRRGDFPGADRGAAQVIRPGPITPP